MSAEQPRREGEAAGTGTAVVTAVAVAKSSQRRAGVLKVEFRVEAPEDEYPAVSQSLVDVVCVCVCVCVSIVYMCMYV